MWCDHCKSNSHDESWCQSPHPHSKMLEVKAMKCPECKKETACPPVHHAPFYCPHCGAMGEVFVDDGCAEIYTDDRVDNGGAKL